VERPGRIIINGATGLTGTLIAHRALELECDIVLGTRSPERLAAAARRLD
jgi:short subunit dehydrogenase-like uncharacterized protein